MNQFARLAGNDFGNEPEWKECASCGKETMRERCWDCEQAAQAAQERRENLAACGLPSRFDWASIDAPELAERVHAKRGLATVMRWAMEAKHLIVAGKTGTGKTSLAVACLRQRAPRCLYVRAERLARAPIEHHAGQGEALIVERAKKVHTLLIDDLGTDERTSVSAVRDVVFARHDANLDTWITTGLTAGQIESAYGEGFRRRVIDEARRIHLERPEKAQVTE